MHGAHSVCKFYPETIIQVILLQRYLKMQAEQTCKAMRSISPPM